MTAASPAELGYHLGIDVDVQRAQYVLDTVRDLIVATTGTPAASWPTGVKVVQLTAAARGYTNPAEKGQETVGSRSYTVRNVGIYLTDAEQQLLRTAAGRSGLSSVPLVVPGEIYPKPDLIL